VRDTALDHHDHDDHHGGGKVSSFLS